jgi:phosphoribosylformimino-5-aminoimidazole carboxamide ribotide isomerase
VPFDLIPAIDLRGGRVVRLRRGDFAEETAYSPDPAAVGLEFAAAGASWIHIVDLDGARVGEPRQQEAIASILGACAGRLACEIAGGLRTDEAVAAALAAGATRVALGTAILRDPAFAARLVAHHGAARIVAAIDVRDGAAVGQAWTDGAVGVPIEQALAGLAAAGIRTFEVTAISRDGLLEGPDLALLRQAVAATGGEVIASGGVSSLADLATVAALGCRGAIVGRALYEGHLDLTRAIAWAATIP